MIKHATTMALITLLTAAAHAERILTPEDVAAITSLEIAKSMMKDVDIGGQKFDISKYERKIADIKKYGLHQANYRQKHGIVDTPKQNKPLSECIKPGNLIDEEVNLCINHKLEKYW